MVEIRGLTKEELKQFRERAKIHFTPAEESALLRMEELLSDAIRRSFFVKNGKIDADINEAKRIVEKLLERSGIKYRNKVREAF